MIMQTRDPVPSIYMAHNCNSVLRGSKCTHIYADKTLVPKEKNNNFQPVEIGDGTVGVAKRQESMLKFPF